MSEQNVNGTVAVENSRGGNGFLVLLRHGQTVWSESGQHTGRTDIPLTAVGEQQAADAGRRLREAFPEGFSQSCVFSSPLKRACQTAELAGFADHGVLDGIAEWDYGRAEGRTRQQVSEASGFEWDVWRDGPRSLTPTLEGDWVETLPSGEQVPVHAGPGETLEEAANKFKLYDDTDGDAWDIRIYYMEKNPKTMQLISSKFYVDGPNAAAEQTFEFGKSFLTQKVILQKNSDYVTFDTTVDWKETEKMLRTNFATCIHTDEVTCNIQYGSLKRPTHRNTSWEMTKFEVCAHKWIDLSRDDYGVALLNDCKYGYAVLEKPDGHQLAEKYDVSWCGRRQGSAYIPVRILSA